MSSKELENSYDRAAYDLPKELFPLIKGLEVQWPEFCLQFPFVPNNATVKGDGATESKDFGHVDSCTFPDLAAYCYTCALLVSQCQELINLLEPMQKPLYSICDTLKDPKKLEDQVDGQEKLEDLTYWLNISYRALDKYFQDLHKSFPGSLFCQKSGSVFCQKYQEVIEGLSDIIDHTTFKTFNEIRNHENYTKEIKIDNLLELTTNTMREADNYAILSKAYNHVLKKIGTINYNLNLSYREAIDAIEEIRDKHFASTKTHKLLSRPDIQPRVAIAEALKDAVEDIQGYNIIRHNEEK